MYKVGKSMSAYISNLKKYQPLLYELVARDVKIKYRKSVLGFLWTILNPLLMMVILSAVFSNLMRFDVENYSLYILGGQILFTFYNAKDVFCCLFHITFYFL